MKHFADTFTLAPDPQAITAHFIATCPDFAHLKRTHIGCLFSQRVILDRGSHVRAILNRPAQVASKQHERLLLEWTYAQLFQPLYKGDLPDFVMFLDHARWQSDTAEQREQLIYHELSHLQPALDEYGAPKFERGSGRMVLKLVSHDAELFYAEIRRYGDVIPTFENTAVAIADAVNEQRRTRGPRRIA